MQNVGSVRRARGSIPLTFDYRGQHEIHEWPNNDSTDRSIHLQAVDTSKVELSELPHAYVREFPYCRHVHTPVH